ncbi:MAG: hypothetical protein PQJ50_16430, partial [Spirochaetales bacterium]|nr:hypothetical protein [Spirochaetales bacterium]
ELALSGSGSETSPFEINSAEALGWIGAEGSPYTLNDHYKQVDDISLEGIEFTPVGFSSNHYVADPFSGSFNGGDFTISSLSRTVSTGYRASGGLFCDVTGVVKNVTLTDYSLIIDTENIYRIGAVIGHLNGGEVSNVTAEGVIEVRGLSESARVGGLVGEISSPGIIRNSVSKGRIDVLDSVTVNNFSLGGILGYSYSSLNNDNKTSGTYIIECTADVIISSAAQSSSEIYAGGLIGQGIFLSCQNSWSFGDIFVPEGYVGGICGNANSSDFVNLFAMNSSLTGRMGDTFRVYRITYSGEMYTNTVYANKDMLINDSPLPANESFGPDGWDYTF